MDDIEPSNRPKSRLKGRPGRPPGPSKMTQERINLILEALEDGMTYLAAARYAGISVSALQDWRGCDDAFGIACDKAVTKWERKHVDNISRAGEGDWRASAWLLSRRFPDRWAERKPEPERQQEIIIKWADDNQ